nr:MAG TPA: Polyubiquitin-B, E3 ubiquitin-protein ligase RAD18 ligase, Ubiquitin, Nucleosome, DNA [Caudoviricetes sp.]DAP68027.1 MAG TPA: Polyubiquitin-B, E3 ubiquitin-protein ligase RAD18 ligase, Ubiquitin, Nucleosome, DNA [Caudoviricetes sp.]
MHLHCSICSFSFALIYAHVNRCGGTCVRFTL